MAIFSKLCLTLFEIANELYIGVGAGFVGMAVLINHGYKTNQMLRTLTVAAISLGSLIYVFQSSDELRRPSLKQIILISGCDSGLGFSLAIHAAKMGFTVVAGFLNLESLGAKEIKQLHKNIKQIQLDVTDKDSVFVALETINQYLNSNPTYEFYALINNAGVMVFGEFEWQTERLILQQLHVNLMGTMNLSKAFIPLLRKSQGRLINVISHCSFECLPGLSVYGATKAGIKALSDGLRVELGKYGVKVVMFTPGSFITECNIMAKHAEHVQDMHRGFTKEQRIFYEDYFQRYHAYLLGIPVPKIQKPIQNPKLYKNFEDALLSESPKFAYKVEPFRYCLYHWLFTLSPRPLRDYFVVKFMSMPEYNPTQTCDSKQCHLLIMLCIVFIIFYLVLNVKGNLTSIKDPGLIKSVKPNFDVIEGLVCYQCRSESTELQPLCDKEIFKLATDEERYNMSIQCPHYQGTYCFTRVKNHKDYVETIRGCAGATDKNGETMKVGCMTTQTEVICLCDEKFCNSALSYNEFMKNWVVFALAVIVYLV